MGEIGLDEILGTKPEALQLSTPTDPSPAPSAVPTETAGAAAPEAEVAPEVPEAPEAPEAAEAPEAEVPTTAESVTEGTQQDLFAQTDDAKVGGHMGWLTSPPLQPCLHMYAVSYEGMASSKL